MVDVEDGNVNFNSADDSLASLHMHERNSS